MVIYRPTPITELKAQTIESIIKAEILQTRKSGQITLTLYDKAFTPAQGRQEAIQRQIQRLERQKAFLTSNFVKKDLYNNANSIFSEVIGPLAKTKRDNHEIDIEKP